MRSDIATSTVVLTAEFQRLDALLDDSHIDAATADRVSATAAATIGRARDSVASAIEALELALTHIDAAGPLDVQATHAIAIADRIILIAPPTPAEAFRTKLKLKTPDTTVQSPSTGAPAHNASIAGPSIAATIDLTRIRGIDRPLAHRLAGYGVASFEEIAGWSKDDVRRITDALGLGRQISRQNWIEQAALLRVSHPEVAAAPPATADTAAIVEDASIAVVDARPAVRAPTVDQLTLIRGLHPSFVGLLHDDGITRWASIAAWRRDDIDLWHAKLGTAAHVIKDNWIEQAAMLAQGRATAYAQHVIAGVYSATVAVPAHAVLPVPVFVDWSALTQSTANASAEEAPVAAIAIVDPVEATVEVMAIDAAPCAPATPLDRVASLEQELAALVANDTSATSHEQAEELAPEAPPASDTHALVVAAKPLNIEDEEFQELYASEADVVIVRQPVPAAPPIAATGGARLPTLRAKRVPAITDIEPERYAAYRDRAEEASVEIVRPNRAALTNQPVTDEELWVRAGMQQTSRPITWLLRNLKRRN